MFGLTDIVALFAKEALLNEVGDPPFFLHFLHN